MGCPIVTRGPAFLTALSSTAAFVMAEVGLLLIAAGGPVLGVVGWVVLSGGLMAFISSLVYGRRLASDLGTRRPLAAHSSTQLRDALTREGVSDSVISTLLLMRLAAGAALVLTLGERFGFGASRA